MGGFESDLMWSHRFMPSIKSIVGPRLLEVSPLYVDRNQGADLLVLENRNLTIACRVRSSEASSRFCGDFTIRLSRDSGSKTELAKVAEGWGDWLFYGFEASRGSVEVDPWWIIDLDAFRLAVRRGDAVEWGDISNFDGTHFRWFRIASFTGDPPLVVDQSNRG